MINHRFSTLDHSFIRFLTGEYKIALTALVSADSDFFGNATNLLIGTEIALQEQSRK